jgi:DNA-binding GntR family transcriptional regulator
LSLKEEAYIKIKHNILTCVYLPDAMLNEEILGEELGMSRTPVRDALSRLEQERLVKILPKRGFVVSALTLAEAAEVYEIRNLLEPYALRTYGERLEHSALERFVSLFGRDVHTSSLDTIFQEDDDFHQLIIGATENPYIIQAYQYPYAQNRRMRVISGHYDKQRLERSQQEHIAIANACLRKDWSAAADAMTKHLDTARDSFYEVMKLTSE